ncbi:hypothetical protein IGI66_000491 [Enterococcus sp. AZ048]|uniref:iron-containing alcohol dehydrogenase n=1 Tax=Enterococcus TaxID=1350 RepID=UPI00345E53EB
MLPHRPFKTIPPIFFDIGISKEVGQRLVEADAKKTMLLYDKGIESTGISKQIAQYIRDAGIELIENNSIQADPPDTSVNAIAEIARAEEIDSIVALGGGSSIDTAKCISLLLRNEGTIDQYYGVLPQNPGVFLIAIPTTAGTGSESTIGGVITDTATKTKKVVGGPGLLVSQALLDPELTVGVPPYITATTGFDSLMHALDGFISEYAGLYTKYQCESTVRLFRKSIRSVVEDGKDIEARAHMMGAAVTGGMIITGASCSLIHSFGHAMGGAYPIAHGNAVTLFAPAVLEFVSEVKPDEIKWIAELFEIDVAQTDSPKEIAEKIGVAIATLAMEMGLKSIDEYEPEPEKLYQIIERAKSDVMTKTTPRPLEDEDAKWIIDRTYEIHRAIHQEPVA